MVYRSTAAALHCFVIQHLIPSVVCTVLTLSGAADEVTVYLQAGVIDWLLTPVVLPNSY